MTERSGPDNQPLGPVKVPEFMRRPNDPAWVCPCKGPQNGEPMCPCQMKARKPT